MLGVTNLVGFGAYDSTIVITEYATFNPSDKTSTLSLSNSNLTASVGSATYAYPTVRGKFGKSSGKWVFEISRTAGYASWVGIGDSSASLYTYVGSSSSSASYALGGNYYAVSGMSNPCTTIPTSEQTKYMIAVDCDNKKAWIAANNESWAGGGDPASGTTPIWTWTVDTVYLALSLYAYAPSSVTLNCGQSAFTHSVPSGFNAGWYI